jgi:hemoglobin
VTELAAYASGVVTPTLYQSLGGFDALLALCRRWHELCLADPLAAHPFSHPGMHPQHDERLAAYFAESTGGPKLYTAGYGDESSMQRLHAGNGEHRELDERCLALFDQALADVGIPAPAAARLAAHFRRATDAQRAYGSSPEDVPAGLALPEWR